MEWVRVYAGTWHLTEASACTTYGNGFLALKLSDSFLDNTVFNSNSINR